MPGKIICFEGNDGAGKTTLAFKLKEFFEEKNYQVRYVKLANHFLSDLFAKCSSGEVNLPFSTRSLLYATNADYSDKMIVRPALENDEIVILDRQYLTLIIYGTMRNKDQKWMEIVNSKLLKPNITFIITANPESIIKYRQKQINLYETIREKEEINNGTNITHNFISFQNEVISRYKEFVDNQSIFEVSNDCEVDNAFNTIKDLIFRKGIIQ